MAKDKKGMLDKAFSFLNRQKDQNPVTMEEVDPYDLNAQKEENQDSELPASETVYTEQDPSTVMSDKIGEENEESIPESEPVNAEMEAENAEDSESEVPVTLIEENTPKYNINGYVQKDDAFFKEFSYKIAEKKPDMEIFSQAPGLKRTMDPEDGIFSEDELQEMSQNETIENVENCVEAEVSESTPDTSGQETKESSELCLDEQEEQKSLPEEMSQDTEGESAAEPETEEAEMIPGEAVEIKENEEIEETTSVSEDPEEVPAEHLEEAVSREKKHSNKKKPQKEKVDADWFNLMNGKHLMAKSFMLALISSILMFLPSILYDQGYFLFLGDFNAQQVPFYLVAHRAAHALPLGWDWVTDLGVNFIGSYSFYLLGSPFFWLTFPFPESAVPYLMGPLLILKYATMAMFATAWLKRYVKNPAWAVIGGLMYAFSGYTIYNTFFNHFLDVMVFFPLMLIALDELVENNTRGVFALSVALCAIVNYVFFAGEAVFVAIYFFMKLWQKSYKLTWKRFFVIAFEAVVGFAMSAFIVWPSLLVMIANPRANRALNGYNFWMYDSERRYWVILLNFFFPPELPSQPIMITDSYMRWSSATAYLPIISMAGVITYVRSNHYNWLKSLLVFLGIFAFIPGLNSTFSAMNSSYYARWFFMLTLVMILASVMAFDQAKEEDLRGGIKIMTVFTIIAVLALSLTPKFTTEKKDVEVTKEVDDSVITTTEKVEVTKTEIGIYKKEFTLPWGIMAGTVIISIFVLYRLMKIRKFYPKLFISYMTLAVCLFGVLYGNYYLVYGKTRSFDTKNYLIPDAIHGKEQVADVIAPPKGEYYRTDNDDSFINIGLYWDVPDMHAFHSLVPASIMEYYKYIGDKRDVNSKMEYKNYASRSLFSVKYFCDRIDYTSDKFGDPKNPDKETKMPGYTYLYDVAGYAVWENNNYVPMGFTYDEYISKADADDVDDSNKDELMMKALILSEEQIAKYGDLLKYGDTNEYSYTQEAFAEDCKARNSETASDFYYDSTGFTAHITLEKDNLVFFSVPFEKNGWTATVNGESVDVENVQIGFMAVKANAGENEIVVTYQTPGLSMGLLVSAGSAAVFVLYWIGAEIMKLVIHIRKKRAMAVEE